MKQRKVPEISPSPRPSPPKGRGGSHRGMTLIEIMIAMTILTLVLVLTLLSLNVFSRTFAVGTIEGDVENAARKGLDEVAQLVLDSGSSTMQELPALTTTGSPVITFRKNLGYKNGAIVFGNLVQIKAENKKLIVRRDLTLATEWTQVVVDGVSDLLEGETLNGADDNGNGLIDESGLYFKLAGSQLTIYLTMEKTDGRPNGRTWKATCSTTVQLRN